MASSEYTITVERIVWNADTLLYSRYSSERLRSDGRSDFYRRYVSGLPAEGWHQANTQSQSNELFGMPTHFYTLATLRRDSDRMDDLTSTDGTCLVCPLKDGIKRIHNHSRTNCLECRHTSILSLLFGETQIGWTI